MHIGIQVVAPEGYGRLEKGKTYHFLRSDKDRDRTLLLHIFEDKRRAHIRLIMMNRDYFENGLCSRSIVVADTQLSLPVWLEALEGIDLSLIDLERRTPKRLHQERIEDRLAIIRPLLARTGEILSAENPEREINRFARACSPVQKESRVRQWFFTYLAFGNESWSLLPPFHRIGKWDRQERFSGKKFGRPYLEEGRLHGYGADAGMIQAIQDSYVKFRRAGRSMQGIYARAIILTFGCKVETIDSKHGKRRKRYFHPEGKPWPTYGMYKYWVIEQFGLEQVQRSVYGNARYRTKIAASTGKFSEAAANLLERSEADGYYTEDYPSGLLEGSILPSLCVVRWVCGASGMIAGIGFSLGKERRTAYQMALFSMAISKVKFCRLFGLDIHPEEWPCLGLPPMHTLDRGPGASSSLVEAFEQQFPIREIAPSCFGQSKATVESSHPREVHQEGRPSHMQSDLTPVEMAKREILRVIQDNNASDGSARRTPEMIAAGITPSPHGIWTYLDCRARTDASPMPFDDAVREFLTPTCFTACADGIYFRSQRYDSPSLRATGLIDRVASGQRVEIGGYILDLSIRYAWVEVGGRLIEVEALLPIRDDEEQLFMSLLELEQLAEYDRSTQSAFREHKCAVKSETGERFEEATGKSWDAGTRRTGKIKTKTRSSHREQADIERYASNGRNRP
ncbi:MAG TPA: hypothetical protein VJ698_20700 [Noviherbaspirillum sp.]|uniref:hypothetical protein n=1 Tax=Noviherbaspirillum sp. TaxID=1926288 RepID=UPI002B4693D6|nr:hypothetical protein [Noviherbaspirillum sp.]HJV87902.1 hypothetical protein [Noviherbaspirillum sp.]